MHDVNVIFEAIKECVLLDKLCQTIHVTINYGLHIFVNLNHSGKRVQTCLSSFKDLSVS